MDNDITCMHGYLFIYFLFMCIHAYKCRFYQSLLESQVLTILAVHKRIYVHAYYLCTYVVSNMLLSAFGPMQVVRMLLALIGTR